MDSYIRDHHVEVINAELIKNVDDYNNNNVLIENLKIFHLNIRSVKKNIDQLNIFLKQFREQFDLIILTETWNIQNTDLFKIPNYSLIYNAGHLNQNDGVLIFVKLNIEYNFEIRKIIDIDVINIIIPSGRKDNDLIITALYRPPSTCPFTFNRGLKTYLESFKKDHNIHILVGDVNINILSEVTFAQEYLNILSELGFTSYINNYTRVQGNQKSCIDHYFVKNKKNTHFFKSFIFLTQITDHYPIVLNTSINLQTENNKNKVPILKKVINYEKLKFDLQREEWLSVYTSGDANYTADQLINTLKMYIEKNTTRIKIKRSNYKRKDWITDGLIKSIKTKDELYQKCINNPHNKNIETEFKIYRNKLNAIIKKTKTKFYRTQIEKNRNSTKQLWTTVNNICSDNKNKNTDINKIKLENGQITTEKIKIANRFNNYFSNIGENLATKIKIPKKSPRDKFSIKNSIYLKDATEKEIGEYIKELKLGKSPGYDLITSETLQRVSSEILAPLTYTINTCLKTGIFPKCLKIGIIKPLYKQAGDKMDVKNYRPISLISNLAKLFEKTIKTRLSEFFDKFGILSDRQFGFAKGKSTKDAIAYLISKIYESMDESTPSICVFIDLAKAFDTVSHKILLEKLNNYGIRGTAFNLLKSYLSERNQFVKIEDISSTSKPVHYGVPQGTVLGPILFSVYINSLLMLQSKGTIVSFADDTAILYKSETWEQLKEIAEGDLKMISQWFNANILTLNHEKTKYLPFAPYVKGLPNLGSLDIGNGLSINEAKSVKYLGIHIDKHLRWDIHITSLVTKIRSLIPKFKFLKDYLTTNELKMMYSALVQSHLEYGIIAWGGVSDYHLNNLNVTQKWILKIIFNKEYTYPSDNLFRLSDVLDIRQSFCVAMLLFQFKNKALINYNAHVYDTRKKNINALKPKVRKNKAQKCYTYLTPCVFDLVPVEVRNINNFNLYKKKIIKIIKNIPRNCINNIINVNRY